MKLTLQPTRYNSQPKVSLELDNDDLTLPQVVRDLIIPALLAWGYQPETIDQYITEEK